MSPSPSTPPLRAAARWGLSALFLALIGCGGAVSGGVIQRADELPRPPASQGFLKLPQAHRSAWIYVDGRFKGRVGDYPLRALLLRAGERRIELRRHGCESVYVLLTISPERPATLSADPLELPAPPPRPQW